MTTSSALVGSSRTSTGGLAAYRARHRQPLTLPTRERQSTLADRLVDAVAAREQVFARRVEERPFQCRRLGIGSTEREVLAQRPVDEPRVMAVDGHDVRTQHVQRQVAGVDTTHEHATAFRIGPPDEEVGDRHRDPGVLGDDTQNLAVGDVERELRQWPVADALELRGCRRRGAIVVIVDRRWRREGRGDAARRGQAGGPHVAHLGERLERDGEEQREAGERHQRAGRQRAVERQATAHPDREREEQRGDHGRERLPRAVEAGEGDGAGAHLRGAFGEPPPHAVFAAEPLDDAETGRDVGRDRRRVGEPLLLLGRAPVVRAPERHQDEETGRQADEDEAPEDRRGQQHAGTDREEGDERARPSTHEVGDTADALCVAGREREERAGFDVDTASADRGPGA